MSPLPPDPAARTRSPDPVTRLTVSQLRFSRLRVQPAKAPRILASVASLPSSCIDSNSGGDT